MWINERGRDAGFHRRVGGGFAEQHVLAGRGGVEVSDKDIDLAALLALTVQEHDAGGHADADVQDEDDEDYETEYSYWGRPYARTPKWFPPVTTPQEAGTKLLMSGEFGRIGVEARSRGPGD